MATLEPKMLIVPKKEKQSKQHVEIMKCLLGIVANIKMV